MKAIKNAKERGLGLKTKWSNLTVKGSVCAFNEREKRGCRRSEYQ